jgi:hypothetical protein
MRVVRFAMLMRVADNSLNQSGCCAVACHAIHLPRIPTLHLDHLPSGCMTFLSRDWQLCGLDVPPEHMRRNWAQSLSYARIYRACCVLVCSSRSSLASSMRIAAPGPQLPLPLYAAPAAAALYFPVLTRAQQQLLLCTTSHAHHYVRVMMARDVRYNRDPRKLLLLCLYSEAAVQRLQSS